MKTLVYVVIDVPFLNQSIIQKDKRKLHSVYSYFSRRTESQPLDGSISLWMKTLAPESATVRRKERKHACE